MDITEANERKSNRETKMLVVIAMVAATTAYV